MLTPVLEPYRFVVCAPMLHPVAARVGDVLVVRPGHAERPLVVTRCTEGEWRAIRIGPPNYGALLVREDEGVIRQLIPGGASLATHPLVQSA